MLIVLEVSRLDKAVSTRLVAVVLALVIVVAAVVAYIVLYNPFGPREEIPSEIRIGTVLPLSGPFSVEGSQALLGMQVAVEWVNQHGGVKFKGKQIPFTLKYYDDQSNPDYAIQLTQKVVTEDKVHIVIHDWGILGEFAAPVTEREGVFSIQWAGGAEKLMGQGFKYMTSFHAPLTSFYKNVLKVIRDADPNAKTVALIWRSQPGIELWTAGARTYAAEYGFNLIYDRGYPPDITDASYILNEIKSLSPDVLLVSCYPPDGYTIVSQMRDLKVNVKWVACQVIVVKPEFAETFNKAAVGFIQDSHWEPEIKWEDIASQNGVQYVGATNEELLQIFFERQGTRRRPAAEYGMAAAQIFLLKKIIEEAQSLEAGKLIEAAKRVDVYTCRGRFKIDPKEPLKQIGLEAPPIVVQWQKHGNKLTYEILYPYEAKTANATPMPTWEEKEGYPTLEIQFFH